MEIRQFGRFSSNFGPQTTFAVCRVFVMFDVVFLKAGIAPRRDPEPPRQERTFGYALVNGFVRHVLRLYFVAH